MHNNYYICIYIIQNLILNLGKCKNTWSKLFTKVFPAMLQWGIYILTILKINCNVIHIDKDKASIK